MSLGEESLESVQYNQYLHVLPYVAAHKHAAAVAVRSVREGEIGDVAHLTNGNLHTRLTLAQLPNGLGWEMKAWEDKESSGVNFPEPLTDFRRRLDVVFMAGAISLVGTDEDDSIDRRPTSGELTAIKDILWGGATGIFAQSNVALDRI